MELTFMGKVYPLVMKRMFRDELLLRYNKEYVSSGMNKIIPKYKNIISRVPDLGGKENYFLKDVYFAAYIIAVYKTYQDKVSVEEMGEMLTDAINHMGKLAKLHKKEDKTSPEYCKKIKDAAAWCEKNRDKYPTNWQLQVKDGVKDQGIYYEFSHCALCELCKREGVEDLTPILCATDSLMLDLCGAKLTRTKTLSGGDDCCDFWITSK